MKIRNGHTTNSSSSSFVVIFTKKITDVDTLQKLLFGNLDSIRSPYDEEFLTTEQITKWIFEDIQNQEPKKLTQENLVEEMINGYGSWSEEAERDTKFYYPSYDKETTKKEWDEYYEKYDRAARYAADWVAEHFLRKTRILRAEKKEFYVFEYGDSHGQRVNTILEHGEIFDAVPHIKISHH